MSCCDPLAGDAGRRLLARAVDRHAGAAVPGRKRLIDEARARRL